MYDVLIIGAGPAGISAAIYAKRANKNVAIIYYGESQLEKAIKIENFYGFPNGISGKELFNNGILQAENFGITIINEEVVNMSMQNDMSYCISTTDSSYYGKTVVLATGNKKLKPDIEGIDAFDGKGISYCAICDGFFYRNKKVAVIGNEKYAINEATELSNVTSDVILLSNGLPTVENEFQTVNKKIKSINGTTTVESITFEDNTKLEIDGIFIALGSASASDLAKKVGIFTKDDIIIVDENMKTNAPGVFACGNATGELLQINKAAYEGALAGIAAINYLKGE